MVQDFLTAKGITALEGDEQIIQLAHAVCNIPWGEARTLEDVLTKSIGTCTGKHVLMQACLKELGIPYRPVVCTFQWGKQGIEFPDSIRNILATGEWSHGHNFVQIQYADGPWVDIDVTWDPPLALHGLSPLPDNWNGHTSFVGLRHIEKRWDGASIAEKKAELIAALSPEEQERRERFLEEFIQWIDSLR
jgi:hypothetical protein